MRPSLSVLEDLPVLGLPNGSWHVCSRDFSLPVVNHTICFDVRLEAAPVLLELDVVQRDAIFDLLSPDVDARLGELRHERLHDARWNLVLRGFCRVQCRRGRRREQRDAEQANHLPSGKRR